MCTSIVSNRKKSIVGWNLDILDKEHKIVADDDKVYIAINDKRKVGFRYLVQMQEGTL